MYNICFLKWETMRELNFYRAKGKEVKKTNVMSSSG